jgi:hypothetical protein
MDAGAVSDDAIHLKDAVITIGRWNVTITGLTPTGAFVTYIASADSYLTQNDGIWFGTQSEYMEETAL